MAAPLERFAGTNKLPLRTTAFGMFGAAVALGHGTTLLERSRRPNAPNYIINHNVGSEGIITLPGCRTDGVAIAPLFESRFKAVGPTAYLTYPERGFSIRALADKIIEAREALATDRVSFCLESMGYIVFGRLAQDKRFRDAIGPITTIVHDSSPGSIRDVRHGPRFALEAASVMRFSWLASRVVPEVMDLMDRRSGAGRSHEVGIDDQLVAQHLYSTNHSPLYVTGAEGSVLRHTHLESNSLADVEVEYLHYIQARHDPVIDTDAACLRIARAYGRFIVPTIDVARPNPSHAVGPEYPSGVANLFMQPQPEQLAA